MTIQTPSVSSIGSWVQDHTTEAPIKTAGFLTKEHYFSRAQVEQHCSMNDGWAIDEKNKVIYNITPLFDMDVLGHPGIGSNSMRESLKNRLGGAQDINEDREMHRGTRTMALWDALKIGILMD